jgi:hypothetical protein
MRSASFPRDGEENVSAAFFLAGSTHPQTTHDDFRGFRVRCCCCKILLATTIIAWVQFLGGTRGARSEFMKS